MRGLKTDRASSPIAGDGLTCAVPDGVHPAASAANQANAHTSEKMTLFFFNLVHHVRNQVGPVMSLALCVLRNEAHQLSSDPGNTSGLAAFRAGNRFDASSVPLRCEAVQSAIIDTGRLLLSR
jgi:hypothetical protein